MKRIKRRSFLKGVGMCAASFGFPTIIPSHVLGQNAPSNTIQIGQIGFGRIAREMDVKGILTAKGVRMVAIADVDRRRLEWGKQYLNEHFASVTAPDLKMYEDYHQILEDKSIDAISISTPDHWHSQPIIEAAFAGKDIFCQKPTALTIDEGRLVSEAIRQTGRIFLLGSQQRSEAHFHKACELVRNGRLGAIKSIEIGFGPDIAGGRTDKMDVPDCLNYDMWLGSTPQVYYTEDRVHSQNEPSKWTRPGWMRCEQFGAGMMTNWGAHHVDIAHWAMGWEEMGPLSVSGTAEFPKSGLWDVHLGFRVTMKYPGDVTVILSDKFTNGIRFNGEKGWIFVSRGAMKATPTDPVSAGKVLKALDASDPKLLEGDASAGGVQLYKHHGNHLHNWIDCIRSRKPTIVPAETAHRSCSACLVGHAALKLGRELKWDYKTEKFIGDDEANALLKREERAPYGARRAYERLSKS